MTYEPTLDATTSPSPRVQVTFTSLASGTERVTVWREYSGLSSPVRDAVNAYAVGGFTVTDYEVPLGVNVEYSAEMYDSGGTSLGRTGATSTVLHCDNGYAWYSSPYDPSVAAYVPLPAEWGVVRGRQRPSERYQIGPGEVVALSGQIGLIEEFNASCRTESLDVADQLKKVLEGGLVLIRTTPHLRVPSLLYLQIDESVEKGTGSIHDVEFGGEHIYWPLAGYEVTPSVLSAGVAVGTWQDVIDHFATWQDVIDNYDTWLDLLQNPPGV